jgi:hypothetical protein
VSIRKRIFQAVVLTTGYPAGRVLSSGAGGQANPGKSPTRPFITLRLQPDGPGMLPRLPVSQIRWNAWVHDEPGTMERIDTAVAALKNGIPGALVGLGEGVRVIETVWEDTFADGYDDHYGTNVTYVDFLTTYKSIP